MAQYPPPGSPENPGQPAYPQYPPTPGYSQQPGYPPGSGYLPPSDYGVPPGPPGAPVQTVQQRRGCRGCLFGCLVAFLATCVVVAIVLAVVFYLFRQAFPTNESFGEAAECAMLRVVILGAETTLEQSEGTAAEKEQLRRQVRSMREEFDRKCVSAR